MPRLEPHPDPRRPDPDRPTTGAARRLPSGEAALQRWRHSWQATRHLDHATAEIAASHGVSLRTLQFIRATGRAGHLPIPDTPPPPPTATTAPLPALH